MRTKLLIGIVLAITSISCRQEPSEGFIMTVRGPVPPGEIGQMLSHEHVLVDWAGAGETGYHRWNRDSVTRVLMPRLLEIKDLGVTGFADCSPAYLGRDPFLLYGLSEKTGIHILTNTGYYGAVENRFIPGYAYRETAMELASRWIAEFENGIEDTGIKPGFIKIGVKEDTLLSELHEKLVRAAAITHRRTGLAIKSHTGGDVPAFDQLRVLKDEGVSPEAFIWTHAQAGTMEKIIEAARMGAWISLDAVNITGLDETEGNLEFYLTSLAKLKDEGLLNRVMISHDAGWYDAGEPGGGGFRGYTDIHRFLLPELQKRGFTGNDITQLLVDNPARAFEIRKRLAP